MLKSDDGKLEKTKMEHSKDRSHIKTCLSKLPEPMGTDQAMAFFAAMQEIWDVCSSTELDVVGEGIRYTRFVVFGPQSAGKTTLIERIVGFPISFVDKDIGTRRPLYVTVKNKDQDDKLWIWEGENRERK